MNTNFFMNKAIEEAKKALLLEEVPIGAILVDNNNNKIISSAYNSVNAFSNSAMHAEMLLINEACKLRNSKYLNQTSIYVTLEPCAMCAAAISEVHIDKIYFGAYDEKKGSLETIMKLYNNKHFFTPEIYGGIQEEQCSQLLKNFFQKKRIK